ncbi:hypothetical protein [Micropruina sp.]|uniref:hypothetical protein n=1 Tax=Micropruina sp. TaxID=2737536 RepID=UPI0039E4A28C
MKPSDEVWDRATMAGGGLDPGEGDLAIAAVLAVHNLAMNGGLLDAVEDSLISNLRQPTQVFVGSAWKQRQGL